jgi:hypothetical protein
VFEHLDKDIGLAPLLNDFPLRPQPFATELSDEAQDRLPRPPSSSAVPRRKSGRRCSPLRLPSRSNLHSSPSLPAVSFLGAFRRRPGRDDLRASIRPPSETHHVSRRGEFSNKLGRLRLLLDPIAGVSLTRRGRRHWAINGPRKLALVRRQSR